MHNTFSSLYRLFTNKTYFKLYYLVVSIIFTTALSLIPNINILTKIAILWSLMLLAIDFFRVLTGKIKTNLIKLPIYLFILLTLIFNIVIYPDVNNIKTWVINLIPLFLFFSIDTIKDEKSLFNEVKLFSSFFILISSIISLISLIMICSNNIIKIPLDPTYPQGGYHEYVGLFSNGNAFGIFSTISIVFTIYLLFYSKSIKSKSFLYLNLLVQSITLILSGGRSAFLVILSLIFIFMYIYLNKTWIRFSLIFLPLLFLITFITTHFNNLRSYLAGRENIWLAAIKVIKKHPLTGVGNTNMVPMVDAAKEKWLYGLSTGGIHNIYIEISTVNGIIAALLIILFILITFFYLVKKIQVSFSFNKKLLTCLFSLFIGLALVNLMESTLLYKISFINIVFWSVTGYLISLTQNNSNSL